MATVLTNAGRDIVTNRIKGAGTEPNYLHWGTGAGTAAVGDTSLFTAASEARTLGTSSRVTTSVANDTYRVVGTLTCAGAGKTITNAGTFDAVSAGNICIKGDHTGVVLNVGESIQYTIDLQFA